MERPGRDRSCPQVPAAKTPLNGKWNTPEIKIGKIKDRIVQPLPPERIYLFGSFAEGWIAEEAAQEFDPLELVYPGKTPAFEKYDEYMPEELVRKGFALGVLDTEGMKKRVKEWG